MEHSPELFIDRIRSGRKHGLHWSNTAATGLAQHIVTDQLSYISENLYVTDQLSIDV